MVNRRGLPGVYIDADMRELEHAMGVVSEFTKRLNTTAHLRTVTDATHKVFSNRFDTYMNGLAKINKDAYHHLYEYSSTGGGYDHVGKNSMKLWAHTKRFSTGASVNFSWQWLPARNYNPTYRQRRRGRIGWDAMRDIPASEFAKLLEKSAGRRHKYVWRAPMLEYGIMPNIYPRGESLAVPVFNADVQRRGYEGGPTLIFPRYASPEHQQPGKVTGNFTAAWTGFWAKAGDDFDEVMGEIIAKDAEKNITQAIRKGKKVPRARDRKFSFTTVTDYREAFAAGQQQAATAILRHSRTIKAIEAQRGTTNYRGLQA